MPKKRHLTTLITARCVLCDHLREKIDCKMISEEQVKMILEEECTDVRYDRKIYHYICLYCFKQYKPLLMYRPPVPVETPDCFMEKIKTVGWTRKLE